MATGAHPEWLIGIEAVLFDITTPVPAFENYDCFFSKSSQPNRLDGGLAAYAEVGGNHTDAQDFRTGGSDSSGQTGLGKLGGGMLSRSFCAVSVPGILSLGVP